MRICLDLRYKTESGASSYMKKLVPTLLRNGSGVEYHAVKYRWQRFDFERELKGTIVAPGGPDWFDLVWTLTVLPLKMRLRRIDLYHALKMPGPYWFGRKTISSVHSITDVYKGRFPRTLKGHLYHFYANPTVRKSDAVIAVSSFVESFLVDRMHMPPAKVSVVPHGLDPTFRVLPKEVTEPVLKCFGLGSDFLLCVGNVFPVKNHITAVKAFAAIAREFPSLDLVIAGGTQDPYCRRVLDTIRALGVEDRVHLIGFVRSADVAALMNRARALVLPSLTEGFGLSMLEAFACGLPVVASRRGSLSELGDGCATFVDEPNDHASFAAILRKICEHPELRENMSRHTLERAAQFSWEKTAREHLRIYQNVSAGKPRPGVPAAA
jgi:glycosyltransferase involved in cell wall biosynthesis